MSNYEVLPLLPGYRDILDLLIALNSSFSYDCSYSRSLLESARIQLHPMVSPVAIPLEIWPACHGFLRRSQGDVG